MRSQIAALQAAERELLKVIDEHPLAICGRIWTGWSTMPSG